MSISDICLSRPLANSDPVFPFEVQSPSFNFRELRIATLSIDQEDHGSLSSLLPSIPRLARLPNIKKLVIPGKESDLFDDELLLSKSLCSELKPQKKFIFFPEKMIDLPEDDPLEIDGFKEVKKVKDVSLSVPSFIRKKNGTKRPLLPEYLPKSCSLRLD